VEQLLHEGVLQSIRGMLPVKSILKEYLADDGDETPAEVAAAAAEEETQTQIQPVIHEESIQTAGATDETPVDRIVLEPVDISGSTPPLVSPPLVAPPPSPASPPSTPVAPPTIIVETEPPTVGFTSMDAVLDVEHPEKTTIQASNQTGDDDDDEHREVTHIEFDETESPEPLDDFETLELAQETVAVGEDEFETL
jgi:hypothetical protein